MARVLGWVLVLAAATWGAGACGPGPGGDADGTLPDLRADLPDADDGGTDPGADDPGPPPDAGPPDEGPLPPWDEGPAVDSGPPPDFPSTRLYFVDTTGDRHLESMRLDGTDLRELGVLATRYESPHHFSLSPDGTRLVYAVDAALRVADTATGDWRPLWSGDPPYRRWSPDSASLLLGQRGVRVLDGDGRVQADLGELDLSGQESVPVAWSRDGTGIAFATRTLDGLGSVVVTGRDLCGCHPGDETDLHGLWDLWGIPGGYLAVLPGEVRLLDGVGRQRARTPYPEDLQVAGGSEWEMHALNPRPDPSGHWLVFFAASGEAGASGTGTLDAWHASRDFKTTSRFARGLDLPATGCPVLVHPSGLALWAQDRKDPRAVSVDGFAWRAFPEDMSMHRVVGWH